jgi:hypothetical protein
LRRGIRFSVGLLALFAAACGGGGGRSPFSVPSKLSLTTTTDQPFAASYVAVRVNNVPEEGVWFQTEHTGSAVHATNPTQNEPGHANVWVYFKAPDTLAPGTYADTVTVRACADALCNEEIKGSPQTIAVTLTVVAGDGDLDDGLPGATAEPGLPALPLADPRALGHNVLDAEYSETLDAIVMIADIPAPALYLYDPTTHTQRAIALDMTPRALSVSPDGLSAAVGHNALITLVDLANIDDPIVSPKTLVTTTRDVVDIVLGDGYAYMVPAGDVFQRRVYTIDLTTHAETYDSDYVGSDTILKRHASGVRMYSAEHTLAYRFDLTIFGGTARRTDVTHETDVCGNLFMDEPGAHIFGACGAVVHASDFRPRDLSYSGQLELTPATPMPSRIRSLSHSTERAETLLLDLPWYQCNVVEDFQTCFTRLGVYDANRKLAARYTLAPVAVAGHAYAQRGFHLFHSADGAKRYLITGLLSFPSVTDAFWIAEVAAAGPAPVPPPQPVLEPGIEPGVPAAPLADITPLSHDIVDAEFSTGLNAIVMASQFPTSAIYVHDLATRTERMIPLTEPPSSLSVAPGGMRAAVGAHHLVTVVDLSPIGAEPPKLLATASEAKEVVLSATHAYAFPRTNQDPFLFTIDVATGASAFVYNSVGLVRIETSARMDPSGTRMYGAYHSSPDDIERYVTNNGPAYVADNSPYHGVYQVCTDLWFNEAGTLIYTACGHTFNSSDDAQDMTYAGTLTPPVSYVNGYVLAGVSESIEASQVAAVDSRSYDCRPFDESHWCLAHLDLYDSASLGHTARYSLPPLTVGGASYRQRNVAVFHSVDGSELFVVSRLYGMLNPYAEYYISRID